MESNTSEKTTNTSSGVSVATIFIILAAVALIVAAVFWGISLTRKYQASSIEKKLASVEEETQGMGDINTKAQQIYAAQKNLETINLSKNLWSVFLSNLSAATTKNVSLTELAMDEQSTITISGNTVSYEALAKFMASLRGSGKYDDVALGSANLSTEGGRGAITFSITVVPDSSAFSK